MTLAYAWEFTSSHSGYSSPVAGCPYLWRQDFGGTVHTNWSGTFEVFCDAVWGYACDEDAGNRLRDGKEGF